MEDRVYNLLRGNPRVEAVRAVQHIQDQEVLDLWMGVQVDQHLLGHNTRHFHLLRSTDYDSHKGHPTLPQRLDHYTRNEVKAEWAWNEMAA